MQSHSYNWFNCFTNEQVKNINKEIKKNIAQKEDPSLLAQDVVKIGKFSKISSNTIIESNVEIGSNCNIGAFVLIRNSIIENNVCISEGTIIGKKGFGFIPFP